MSQPQDQITADVPVPIPTETLESITAKLEYAYEEVTDAQKSFDELELRIHTCSHLEAIRLYDARRDAYLRCSTLRQDFATRRSVINARDSKPGESDLTSEQLELEQAEIGTLRDEIKKAEQEMDKHDIDLGICNGTEERARMLLADMESYVYRIEKNIAFLEEAKDELIKAGCQ